MDEKSDFYVLDPTYQIPVYVPQSLKDEIPKPRTFYAGSVIEGAKIFWVKSKGKYMTYLDANGRTDIGERFNTLKAMKEDIKKYKLNVLLLDNVHEEGVREQLKELEMLDTGRVPKIKGKPVFEEFNKEYSDWSLEERLQRYKYDLMMVCDRSPMDILGRFREGAKDDTWMFIYKSIREILFLLGCYCSRMLVGDYNRARFFKFKNNLHIIRDVEYSIDKFKIVKLFYDLSRNDEITPGEKYKDFPRITFKGVDIDISISTKKTGYDIEYMIDNNKIVLCEMSGIDVYEFFTDFLANPLVKIHTRK